ncbi:hypothetical protein AV530_004325 [Patagioenas fasciata monilis]|uniref:Uncharacterized protein n=1 Tax=Patagioenas fasciata monilis TaxID=372326 RepID=A0A1V4K905_PATFA|nr:hypothetical protein AV530_004325 [Patagioenas fasciata monilis]
MGRWLQFVLTLLCHPDCHWDSTNLRSYLGPSKGPISVQQSPRRLACSQGTCQYILLLTPLFCRPDVVTPNHLLPYVGWELQGVKEKLLGRERGVSMDLKQICVCVLILDITKTVTQRSFAMSSGVKSLENHSASLA